MLLCVGTLPTMVFAANGIVISKSAKNTKSYSMVFTVDGEKRTMVYSGETVQAEITVKPKDGMDLAYVIVGNSYSPTQGGANDISEDVNFTQISSEVTAEGEYKLVYEFIVPETSILCVRVVCDVPPEPEPEPEIEISTKSPASVEYDSGAVEFLGVVTDKTTGSEITEGEVQYYLNGNKLFSAVRYDSARIEKGFYRSVSTDEVFDETALQMGQNSIYAVYSDGDGHTATSNTIEINVGKKDICKEQSPISTAYSIGKVYDGTPGYGRAQFSVMANDDYWQRRNVSIENLSFTAEKDGVEYELTPSDYEYKGNTGIVFAAPYTGTYTFTAHVNHEYYTGEKSVTVTVGKRDIVISPEDAFTNRNTEPEFNAEIGGLGLAEGDELKNVQYKIEDGADLGVPGEYGVEIVSYELDNADCYNVTLEGGTLTVHEDADYTAVKAALDRVSALDRELYVDFTAVDTAVANVDYGKNITQQAEVDAMADAINAAVDALEYKTADYTAVNDAITKANALNKDDYKDFSGVEAAIAAVVWDKDITEQAEVDAMAQAINDAINALEEKEVTPSDVSDTTQTNDTEKPASAQNGNTGSATSPKTGADESFALLWVSVLAACAAVLTIATVYGKKKKHSR